jgi:hypothetical protein
MKPFSAEQLRYPQSGGLGGDSKYCPQRKEKKFSRPRQVSAE